MANYDGQDRDGREDTGDEVEDPVLAERVRADLRAALDAPAEFRSRRASIMAQIRAEAASPPAPIPVRPQPESVRPQPATAGREPLNLAAVRAGRSFRPWLGALAASLVVLVVAAVMFNLLATNNTRPGSGVAQQDNRDAAFALRTTQAAATIPADKSSGQSAPAGPVVTFTAGASSENSGAAGAAAPPPQATRVAPAAAAATTAAAASTTAAATTRAAATTAAAAAGTSAAATTRAAATTAATAATTAAAAASGSLATTAAGLPFGLPLYPGATLLPDANPGGLRSFLLRQTEQFVPEPVTRGQQGVQDTLIQNYNFQGSKVANARNEDVIAYYIREAQRLGFRQEAIVNFQDDNRLRARWLYLGRGATERVGILVVEALETGAATGLTQTTPLNRGETGIFFATGPQ